MENAIKLHFSIIFFVLVVLNGFTPTKAAVCDAPDDGRIARVYYVNGMFTSPDEARQSMLALEASLNHSDYSIGLSRNVDEEWHLQVLQVAEQRSEELLKVWGWIKDPTPAPNWFKTIFAAATNQMATRSASRDLVTMISEYLEDLRSGKKVVLVAHSQGNFFANLAVEYIYSEYPKYRSSTRVVGVGTPTSYIGGGGFYTTNSLDRVMNVVRFFYSDTLPGNVTFNSFFDSTGHSFIGTYLTAYSDRIKSHVEQTVTSMVTPEKHPDCDKDQAEITSEPATSIEQNSVKLSGRLTKGDNVDVWHEIGNSNAITCNGASKDGIGPYSATTVVEIDVAGLSPETIYYSRMCAMGKNRKVSSGVVRIFKTLDIPEVPAVEVVTGGVSNLGLYSATVTGDLVSGNNADVWAVHSKISPICSASSEDGVGPFSAPTSVESNLTGLTSSTRYYYRFCAMDTRGIARSGIVKNFTTAAQVPAQVTTLNASNVLYTSADLHGYLSAGTNALVWVSFTHNDAYFSWQDCEYYLASVQQAASPDAYYYAPKNYAIEVNNLSPNSRYYYRYCAYSVGSVSQGETKYFETIPGFEF